MKEDISIQHVEYDGFGAMDFGMATTLLREKFIDCGVHVYEPSLVRCEKFGGFIGILVAERKITDHHGYNHCNVVSLFRPTCIQNLSNKAYFVVEKKKGT